MAVIERPPSADFYFGWWYAGFGSDFTGAIDSSVGRTKSMLLHPITLASFARRDHLECKGERSIMRNVEYSIRGACIRGQHGSSGRQRHRPWL